MQNDLSPTVLFLCTGNYYRSRFAEIYFNALAVEHESLWRADSRGLRIHPDNPGPISMHTIRWLTSMGIRLPDPHRYPLALAEYDLTSAHLVVAVKEAEHRPLLEAHYPAWADRVEYWHIHDLDEALPESALPLLCGKVEELMKRLRSVRA
jgi:protein-tyrosine phosphatase